MRAAIMVAPHAMHIGDWESPHPGPGEVVVSVQAAGMGGYELQGGEWSAGIYLVRLTTERGEQSVRSVVV